MRASCSTGAIVRVLLVSGMLLAAPAAGQSPGERRFLDSLLDHLAGANSAASVPAVSHCAGRSGDITLLCEGLLVARRADFARDKIELAHARDRLERVVADQERWPYAWYALGVMRLDAVSVGMLARDGPLQPIGVSNQSGATYALVRALELDSTFRRAAEALATAPMPPAREGASRLGERMRMLRRVRGALSAGALYGAAQVELDAGSADSAIALTRLALDQNDAKVPRGAMLLTEARALYLIGSPAAGRAAFLEGASDTASRALYREQVAWIGTPAELTAWDSLPAAVRPGWLAHFWGKRDVADGRPEGARLAEHFRRLNYAMAHYRVVPPPSGRHFLSQNMTDAFLHVDPEAESNAISAASGDVGKGSDVFFETVFSPVQFAKTMGTASPLRTVGIFQQLLDDRGILYVRHGPPDKVALYSGDGVMQPAAAIWRYDLPDGRLLLQFIEEDFDGTTEANMLVPTLVFERENYLKQMCWIDASLCPLPKMSLAMKAGRQQKGLEQVKRAVSTDEFVRPFATSLHPLVQVYGLDRLPGGSSRLVVPFAIPGEELKTSATVAGRAIYPVRLQLMAARRSDGRRFDLDTLREFAAPHELRKGEYLNGLLELPVEPGTYTVSLVFAQRDQPNAIAHLSDATVVANKGALAVSDLVLGRASSGVHWNSGTTIVPLNPLNLFPKNGDAEAYFQLAGMVPGTTYQTSFEFFRFDDKPTRPPRLSISFSSTATSPRLEVSRSVGLKNLDPGRYRMKVTVRGGGSVAETIAWLAIASR